MVDYIGGDYQNAVKNGEIINNDEYNEMLEFSAETKEIFETLKSSDGDKAKIESEVNELSALIVSKIFGERSRRGLKKHKRKIDIVLRYYPASSDKTFTKNWQGAL